MKPSTAFAAALLLVATPLLAQEPADSDADAHAAEHSEHHVQLTTGLAAGALSYVGGHAERAVAGVARLQLRDWVAVSVSPSVGQVTEPAAAGGARLSASGITDVPVGLEVGRSLPLPGSPSLGVGYSVTVPVGDTATGFGSGTLGSSVSVSAGLSPLPRVSLYAGAGRSLSDFSLRSVMDGTAGTWGDASASVAVSSKLELSGGVSGDLGAIDTTLGRTLAVSAGAAFHVGRVPLSLNVSRGVSGAAPRWSMSLALGSAFAYIGGIGHLRSPEAQIEETFGGGRHGLPPNEKHGGASGTTSPGNSGSAPGHSGSAGGNDGVGHGNGRKKSGG